MRRTDDAQGLSELRQATSEEWARLEGEVIGRVLDDEPPTEPELWIFSLDDAPPTEIVLPTDPPEWAVSALHREALGLGPYDPTPAPTTLAFAPQDTVLVPPHVLDALRRRSSPPR